MILDMKKAFIILAHHMPEQLNIFIRQLLGNQDNDIYIHVNKKNEPLKEKIIKDKRVYISDQNIEITWGSDEILKALIIMLRQVVSSRKEYQYIIVNSGQDLFVRSGLDDFLSSNFGKVFIDGYMDDRNRKAFLLHDWPDRYRTLIDFKFHPIKLLRRLRLELFKAGIPIDVKKVDYDVSSIVFYRNWFWCAMPDFIGKYIIDFLDNNPTFWEIYDKALVPEEGFFSTIIMNSKYKDCIDYQDGKSSSLVYDGPRKNGHSGVITMSDIENIKNSGKFFARKFDIGKDREVVEYFANQKDM